MPQLNGPITPMEDASAVSRDAGNPPVRFDVAGAGDGVMEPLNGHEAGNGGHSQWASCTPPRRSPTRLAMADASLKPVTRLPRITPVASRSRISNSRRTDQTSNLENPRLGNHCRRCIGLWEYGSSSPLPDNRGLDHSCCTARLASGNSRLSLHNQHQHDSSLARTHSQSQTCREPRGTRKSGHWGNLHRPHSDQTCKSNQLGRTASSTDY
jgi:hypothetical protein